MKRKAKVIETPDPVIPSAPGWTIYHDKWECNGMGGYFLVHQGAAVFLGPTTDHALDIKYWIDQKKVKLSVLEWTSFLKFNPHPVAIATLDDIAENQGVMWS